MSDAFADAMAWKTAQVEEYSQYTASAEIRNSTGVVVYGMGWPVPAGNVEKDGAIILYRHACPGVDPLTGETCSIEHNAILERTGPGMARKVTKAASGKGSN